MFSGRLKEVDFLTKDIFLSRLKSIAVLRDELVYQVKSFVNGDLGKLAAVSSRYFLRSTLSRLIIQLS